jgi:hypothetical protein
MSTSRIAWAIDRDRLRNAHPLLSQIIRHPHPLTSCSRLFLRGYGIEQLAKESKRKSPYRRSRYSCENGKESLLHFTIASNTKGPCASLISCIYLFTIDPCDRLPSLMPETARERILPY